MLLVFFRAVYVKAVQMDPGLTGVNRINMTGNVNDKLEKRKVEKSVKRTKSHIMNNLLTSFARSARESICSRDFCTKILGNYFSVYSRKIQKESKRWVENTTPSCGIYNGDFFLKSIYYSRWGYLCKQKMWLAHNILMANCVQIPFHSCVTKLIIHQFRCIKWSIHTQTFNRLSFYPLFLYYYTWTL